MATEGVTYLSDKLILVAMLCIVALTLTPMFFYSTYKKEKLELKSKINVKDLIDSEVAVTAEDKNKNSKK